MATRARALRKLSSLGSPASSLRCRRPSKPLLVHAVVARPHSPALPKPAAEPKGEAKEDFGVLPRLQPPSLVVSILDAKTPHRPADDLFPPIASLSSCGCADGPDAVDAEVVSCREVTRSADRHVFVMVRKTSKTLRCADSADGRAAALRAG